MKTFASISAALAAVIVLSGCAIDSGTRAATRSETISGPAVARDGDTVEINGTLVDLWGVDAPSNSNSDGWRPRAALDELIGAGGSLTCTIKKKSSKRVRAVCSNGEAGDVGRALLLGGWAIVNRGDVLDVAADRALAHAYANAETRARKSRAGLWSQGP